jgi:hypothetical protein
MSYKLNKTDGTLLVDLIDGSIDTATTSLTLIGKNYSGFGEVINENYIKLLESFSNSTSPLNPIAGQVWWDTSDARLKVYTGTSFNPVGAPFVQSSQPGMVAGDLWINNNEDQLYFFDGTGDPTLAGPAYSSQQGKSGFIIVSRLDTQSRNRTCADLYVAGTLMAVMSAIEFTPATAIAGITGNVKKGINVIDTDSSTGFTYQGVADKALNLIKADGTSVSADSFLSALTDGSTTGSLQVLNSNGITVGPNANQIMKIVGNSFVTENARIDDDYIIKVTSSAAGSQVIDALHIDASTKRVGIFQDTPLHTLDVTGDMRVTGNLIVEGNSASIDVATLRVEDKQIELAITSDSTLLDDAGVNDAGLLVRVTGDDKSFTWKNATKAWTSSEHMDIVTGKSYKIGGTDVLSATTLASSVTSATGLTTIGTLGALSVDNMNLNNATITTTALGLTITSADTITISNSRKITGVGAPTAGADVANKTYVDEQIAGSSISFSMDITSLNDTQIASVINDLVPAASVSNGTTARIHGTSLTGATVTGIDVGAVLTKSFITVDKNGTENQSVLQDIGFTNATGTVAVAVSRSLKQFITSGGNWTFDQNLTSSV